MCAILSISLFLFPRTLLRKVVRDVEYDNALWCMTLLKLVSSTADSGNGTLNIDHYISRFVCV